jgi:hypothetical protein
MRPLILGPEERTAIADLIAQARAHRISYEGMRATAEAYHAGHRQPRRQNFVQTIPLPVGFTVTYTEEYHRPEVPCRHLSVSVDDSNKAPNPVAVSELMRAFGFHHGLGRCPAWFERLADGGIAINALEPLDGDLAALAGPVPGGTAV